MIAHFLAFMLTFHLGILLGFVYGWRHGVGTAIMLIAAIVVVIALVVLGPEEAASGFDVSKFIVYAMGWAVGTPFGRILYVDHKN